MTRSLILAGAMLLWMVGPLVVFGVLQEVLNRSMVLQSTAGEYAAMGVVALAWAVPVAFGVPVLLRSLDAPRALLGLVLWAGLCGLAGGRVALTLINGVGCGSTGEQVATRVVSVSGRNHVVLRVVDPRYSDLEFRFRGGASRPGFTLHKGRLGLYWGEWE